MKKEGSTASMLWLDIRRGFCSKRFWWLEIVLYFRNNGLWNQFGYGVVEDLCGGSGVGSHLP